MSILTFYQKQDIRLGGKVCRNKGFILWKTPFYVKITCTVQKNINFRLSGLKTCTSNAPEKISFNYSLIELINQYINQEISKQSIREHRTNKRLTLLELS